jgi:uncharacterized protein (TIGR03083 family)
MQPVGPIYTLDLFPEMQTQLLHVLSSLTPDEWASATACDGWSVKDIAAHIVADDLGVLSRGRDKHRASFIDSESLDELIAAINAQNEAWVSATRRLSPQIICDLLWMSGEQLYEYFCTLDPHAIGDPVSWAGPERAPVWFDIAREYTERWLHTAQICEATGRPLFDEPRLFTPLLDTFVRALPYTYRGIDAPDGTHVRLEITGAAGGTWSLVRDNGRWVLCTGVERAPDASVTLAQDAAWRLFTKGMTPAAALELAASEGDAALADRALGMVSILA